jgi:hypothetical protein
MRTIQVSVDVFHAIWTRRKPGEESEDAILRREFGVPAPRDAKSNGQSTVPRDFKVQHTGFHDPRYGVEVPSGFEIFRTYKGKDYKAQAIQGFWIYNGKGYPSLNELNTAIGVSHENAWSAWRYHDNKGRQRPLTDLRDPSTIRRRRTPLIEELA